MMRGIDEQDMADAAFLIRHDRITPAQLEEAFTQMKPIELVELRDAWRVRVGDYRIVYTIKDDVLLVLVLRVGHRREVYKLTLPSLTLTAEEDED